MITLLNACIKHKGYSPIKYGNGEFKEWAIALHNDFKSANKHIKHKKVRLKETDVYQALLDRLGVEALYYKNQKHSHKFYDWVCNTLKNGGYIDFAAYVRNMHSMLISDYSQKFDSFQVINGKYFADITEEWLPMPVLLKNYVTNTSFKNWNCIPTGFIRKKEVKSGVDVFNMESQELYFK